MLIRCAFCRELERISIAYAADAPGRSAAIDALFDLADRARHARRTHRRRRWR